MTNRYFLILKAKKTGIFYMAIVVFAASAFLFNFLFLEVRADTIAKGLPAATSQLLDKPIFKENEQTSTMIHTRFNDGRTNIIFYIDYGNNNFQYAAETVGRGNFLFSEYYDPAPGVGKYIVVEYFNDGGIFSCSGVSLNECVADPHFISQFNFEIVDNNAIVPAFAPPTIDFIESGAVIDTLYVGGQASSTTLIDKAAPVAPTSGPAPVIQVNEDRSVTIDIIETGQVIENDAGLAPTPVIQVNEDRSVIIDIIETGAVTDNYAAPVVPVPWPTSAPVIQVNEDGSIKVDIIETGQVIENDAEPAPAVPASVIQVDEDGSTTFIAI